MSIVKHPDYIAEQVARNAQARARLNRICFDAALAAFDLNVAGIAAQSEALRDHLSGVTPVLMGVDMAAPAAEAALATRVCLSCGAHTDENGDLPCGH